MAKTMNLKFVFNVLSILLITVFIINAIQPIGIVQAKVIEVENGSNIQLQNSILQEDLPEITPLPSDLTETIVPTETTDVSTETPTGALTETPTLTSTSSPTISSTPTITPTTTSTPTTTIAPTETATPVSIVPNLSFDFTVKPEHAAPGDTVTYTILITNNETLPVTGLVFNNELPQEIEFIESDSSHFVFDPQTRVLSWNAEDKSSDITDTIQKVSLVSGESLTLTYQVQVADKLKDVKIIDSAKLYADGLPVPLIAKTELMISKLKHEKVKVDPAGGKVTGLNGIISLDIPEGALPSSSEIGIESETNQNKALVENSGFTFSLELFTAQKTEEPLITQTTLVEDIPAIGTPTPQVDKTSDTKTDLSASVGQEINSASEETQATTPEPTEQAPTETPTESPTETPTEPIDPQPTPIADLEIDQVIIQESVEAIFSKPIELTILLDDITDLSTLNADQEPFLVTLDKESGTWIRVPLSKIDKTENSISAEINHFSTWGVGIGPSFPQNGANVLASADSSSDLFTGRTSYSLPIWAPPGRNDMAPALSLSYSSGTADGVLGDVQAPWVGMGWNIDTVEIKRKITNGVCNPCGGASYGYVNDFELLFNGTSYPLILDGTTAGRYHTQSETYMYIQLHNDDLGNNIPAASNITGEWWEVVEKDGTHWRLGATTGSEQVAAMKGYPGDDTGTWAPLGYAGYATNVVAFRWRANQVVDTFGNLMTTTYTEETRLVNGTTTYYDRANYMDTISYTGHTTGTPAPAYSIVFILESRGTSDVPLTPNDWDNWDTSRLDRLEVRHGATVVRTYDLGFNVRSYTDDGVSWDTTTLTSVAVSGGTTSQPAITFGYTDLDNRANCGTNCQEWAYPRISSISNGWGAVTSYTFANDGRPSTSWYNWKVNLQSISDGVNANPMRASIAYSTSCYDDVTAGRCNTSNIGKLIGYGQATKTTLDFDGTTTLAIDIHNFYTDLEKSGKEYQVQNQNASGTTLSQTSTAFSIVTSGLPTNVYFTYPNQVDAYLLGSSLNRVSRVAYTYDSATGNLTSKLEYDGTPTLYRQTIYDYVTNTSPSVWILDTLSQKNLQNSSGNTISKQQYGYDGNLPGSGTPTYGALTLSRIVSGTETSDTGFAYNSTYGYLTETRIYNSYGQTTSLPSASYRATTQTYDSTGTFIVTETNPLNQTVTIGYDYNLGLPTIVTNANGNTTTTTYDGLGRETTITYPGYTQANVKYTYPGSTVSVPYTIKMEMLDENPEPDVYRSAWQLLDGLGRVIQVQGPAQTAGDLLITDTSYNALNKELYSGQSHTITATGGVYSSPVWTSIPHTNTIYDALGRTTSIVYADGTQKTSSYSGLRTTYIDQNNHQTVQENDPFGRLIKKEDYTGSSSYSLYSTTRYGYDLRDLLTQVIDAANNQTIIGYDAYSRKVSMSDPDRGNWTYEYDVYGNLIRQSDARACIITVTYDALNRSTGKSYSGGSGAPASCAETPSISYSYDSEASGNEGIGLRTGMTDGSGSTIWKYNVQGQIISDTKTVDGTTYTTNKTFDAFGRLMRKWFPSGEENSYTYNAMGALYTLWGQAPYLYRVTYDGAGQRTLEILGNDVQYQTCYDPLTSRITKKRAYLDQFQDCGQNINRQLPYMQMDYFYDYQPNGNISSIVDGERVEATNLTYDELNRLVSTTGLSSQTTSYNSISNITNASTSHEYISVSSGSGFTCGLTSDGKVRCWGITWPGQSGDGVNPSDVVGLNNDIIAITTGNKHACALSSSGGVKCWGDNTYGQLGDGTFTTPSVPVDVTGLSDVIKISAGYTHTCALTSGGAIKCWGYNGTGALGNGNTTNSSTPVDVIGMATGMNDVKAGIYHTCALFDSGSVNCWGSNSIGQLGDGSNNSSNTPVQVSGLTSGVKVIGESSYSHTCVIMNSGGAKCWGSNWDGQLGNDSTSNSNIPVDVSGLTSGVAVISAGQRHTCAVLTTGGVKCWGYNEFGQLGDGTNSTRTTPILVFGLNAGIIAVTSGLDFSCVLSTIGEINCWGDNNNGQLGNGNSGKKLVPTSVSGLASGISTLTIGKSTFDYSCSLSTSGNVKCWGNNRWAQLGDGSRTNRLIPVSVFQLASGVTAISASDFHTCGVTSSGGAKCWGTGNLGDGQSHYDYTPPTDVTGLGSGVIDIASGKLHDCVLTSSGGVKCWGENWQGACGDGTWTNTSSPVNVFGLSSGVVAISANGYSTCALTDAGAVKCWGRNEEGQLGDGTTTTRNVPVNVVGLSSGVIAISVGMNHSCAVLSNGGVKCWGENSDGQLGDGTYTRRLTPVDVSGLSSGINDVSTAINHTCVETSSGGVKCWGGNAYGQLGNNTLVKSNVPVEVVGLSSGVAALASGNSHNCVVMSSIGGVKCWGSNSFGQLGNGEKGFSLYPVAAAINTPNDYSYSDTSHKHAVTLLSNGNSYTYDANGNMTQRIEGGVTYNQVFDAENHLVSVTYLTPTDGCTNDLKKKTYVYDANGNMTSRIEGCVVYTQVYDAENRLISVNKEVLTETTISNTIQFVYDGIGNMVKTIKPDNSSTTYVGAMYEVNKNSTGTVTGTTSYYDAAGAYRTNGELYFVKTDIFGSATAVMNYNRIFFGTTRFFPFGETRITNGELFTDRLFMGRRYIPEIGLYYDGSRFYDPEIARFIQPDKTDPVRGETQSLNNYGFLNNNPFTSIKLMDQEVTLGGE